MGLSILKASFVGAAAVLGATLSSFSPAAAQPAVHEPVVLCYSKDHKNDFLEKMKSEGQIRLFTATTQSLTDDFNITVTSNEDWSKSYIISANQINGETCLDSADFSLLLDSRQTNDDYLAEITTQPNAICPSDEQCMPHNTFLANSIKVGEPALFQARGLVTYNDGSVEIGPVITITGSPTNFGGSGKGDMGLTIPNGLYVPGTNLKNIKYTDYALKVLDSMKEQMAQAQGPVTPVLN